MTANKIKIEQLPSDIREAFESITMTVLIWDFLSGTFYSSDSFREFMAHRNHPKQQRPEELELTDPEHRPDYMKFIRKAESGAKTEVAVMKVKMADGDFHYARMSARAVMARSQISVFVMTILDIHDLVHKEKQLSETRMELDG